MFSKKEPDGPVLPLHPATGNVRLALRLPFLHSQQRTATRCPRAYLGPPCLCDFVHPLAVTASPPTHTHIRNVLPSAQPGDFPDLCCFLHPSISVPSAIQSDRNPSFSNHMELCLLFKLWSLMHAFLEPSAASILHHICPSAVSATNCWVIESFRKGTMGSSCWYYSPYRAAQFLGLSSR